MSGRLTLRVRGRSLTVPRKCVLIQTELFEVHPDLHDDPSYEVRSEVDAEDCQVFTDFLQTEDESLVTTGNRRSLQALAEEFRAARLFEICSDIETTETNANLARHVSQLSETVAQQIRIAESVERDFPLSLCEFLRGQLLGISEEIRAVRQHTDDRYAAVREEVRTLREETGDRFSGLSEEVAAFRKETEGRNLGFDEAIEGVRASIRGLSATVELHHVNFSKQIQCPLKEGKLQDGIISYLTKKHGGNVDDKRVVSISARAVPVAKNGPRNVAEFTDNPAQETRYWSENAPDQWVCWDFLKMLVRPTDYAIKANCLKSWVVEGSMDGRNRTEIDRQTDTEDFNTMILGVPMTASFTAAHPMICRFIRLMQTGKRHDDRYMLDLREVEFFGSLSE
jgi:hypothetical protein